ncbi:hypothetical protein BIWAKO_04083 [Bosea sp. BIWAKO-01]|nr:hypothetical protein BIWAKO_04083 [Bosea sp. BIWAKO-01]
MGLLIIAASMPGFTLGDLFDDFGFAIHRTDRPTHNAR